MSATKEEDVCNHIKVVVRVRPESQKEKESNFTKVVHVVDQHILVFDPKEEEVSFFHGKKVIYRDINKRQKKDLKFVFDAIFAESSTQLEVFEHTTKSVIDGFLNGYNCTGTTFGTPLQEMSKNTQQTAEFAVPPQKRTRKKLIDSPVAAQSPAASKQSSLCHLEDSLTKEVNPIVYSPKFQRKPVESLSTVAVVKKALYLAGLQEAKAHNIDMPVKKQSVLDTTCDIIPECTVADMNSTVILYEGTGETTEMSTESPVKKSQPCINSILHRLERSSLKNKNPTSGLQKPSYMAMTSAERKSKILSSTSNTGLGSLQGTVSAERIRQKVLLSHTALRVPRMAGMKTRGWKQEQDVPRSLVTSTSEGNTAFGVKSRTSKNHLLRVCKQEK